MTLPALTLGWVQISRRSHRFWALSLTILILPVFGALHVAPFDKLFEQFDSAWLAAVEEDNSAVFLSFWKWKTWSILIYDILTLLMVRYFGNASLKFAAEGLLIIITVALTLNLILCDLWLNVFVTELQVWRAIWLVHLFALLTTPWLYIKLIERHNGVLIVSLWYLALIASEYVGGVMAAGLAIILIWSRNRVSLSRIGYVLGLTFIFSSIAAVTFKDFKFISYIGSQINSHSDFLDALMQALTRPFFLSLFALAFFNTLRKKNRIAPIILSSVAIGIAIANYDQRTPWGRFVENGLSYRHPFEKYLTPGSQVYWQGEQYGLLGTWLLLKHPSYLTTAQGGGVVFSRETAHHYRERQEAFAPLNFQESICAIFNSINDDHCAVDVSALIEACTLPDAPDFMIIESRIPDLFEAEWTFKTQRNQRNTFYLYRCSRLHAGDHS